MPAGTLRRCHRTGHRPGVVATTPNFSFITPNLCDDGHDAPCTNTTGVAAGGDPSAADEAVADTDTWLQTWVPIITSSPAFQKDGLLEITFDEAEDPTLDTTACCGETAGPAASGGDNGLSGPGGGKVGAILISPFITPGLTVTKFSYNHFSSLASVEDLFGPAPSGRGPDGDDDLRQAHLRRLDGREAGSSAGRSTGLVRRPG